MTEHARLIARQPDRTRVQRANDNALEYAILAARLVTVLGAFGGLAALLGWVWTGDERWAVTAVVVAAVASASGWWGWWIKGNEEWRHGDA